MISHFIKLCVVSLCAASCLTLHGMNVITCRTIKSENAFFGLRPRIVLNGNQLEDRLVATSGDYLAAVCGKDICVWDLGTGKFLYTISQPFDPGVLPCHIVAAHGKLIALNYNSNTVRIWNLAHGNLLNTFNDLNIKSFTVIDKKIVIFTQEHTFVRDIDGQCLFTIPYNYNAKIVGDKIVVIKNDKTVAIWNLDGSLINTFDDCSDEIKAITLTDNMVIYAARDNTVKVRDLNNGRLVRTLDGNTDNIRRIEAACSKIITQQGWDPLLKGMPIKIWNFEGHCLHTFSAVDFRVTENSLVLDMSGGRLDCINLKDGNQVSRIGRAFACGFTIIDNKMVTKNLDDTIKILSLPYCKLLHELSGIANRRTKSGDPFIMLIVSENKIITMPDSDTIKIWTDTRPEVSSSDLKKSELAFAAALHPRCGKNSPAKILNQYLMQEISMVARLEPWAASDLPMEIRYISDETPNNTSTCVIC